MSSFSLTHVTGGIGTTAFTVGITARAAGVFQKTGRAAGHLARSEAARFLDCGRRGIHRCAVLLHVQVEVGATHNTAVIPEAVFVTGLEASGTRSTLEAGNVEHEVTSANDEFGGGDRFPALLARGAEQAVREEGTMIPFVDSLVSHNGCAA